MTPIRDQDGDYHPPYERGQEMFHDGEPRPREPDPGYGERDIVPAQMERQGWDDASDDC